MSKKNKPKPEESEVKNDDDTEVLGAPEEAPSDVVDQTPPADEATEPPTDAPEEVSEVAEEAPSEEATEEPLMPPCFPPPLSAVDIPAKPEGSYYLCYCEENGLHWRKAEVCPGAKPEPATLSTESLKDLLLDACRDFVFCENKAVLNGSMRHRRSIKKIKTLVGELTPDAS